MNFAFNTIIPGFLMILGRSALIIKVANSSEECFNFDILTPDNLRTMAGRSGFDH